MINYAILKNLDEHIANFALTDRSRWLLDAAREKMAKEKIMLSEIEENEEENNKEWKNNPLDIK